MCIRDSFLPLSESPSQSEKSTLGLQGTATDPHCGISSMWGSSPGQNQQPYPLTKPRHSHLLCTFLLYSAKLTFLSSSHSFTYSIHFFFGLPAGRFPTHSPLYTRLTNRLSFILSTCPNHLNVLSLILSFTPFFTPHNSCLLYTSDAADE